MQGEGEVFILYCCEEELILILLQGLLSLAVNMLLCLVTVRRVMGGLFQVLVAHVQLRFELCGRGLFSFSLELKKSSIASSALG